MHVLQGPPAFGHSSCLRVGISDLPLARGAVLRARAPLQCHRAGLGPGPPSSCGSASPPGGGRPGATASGLGILRLPVGPGLACGASQPRPGASGGLLQARAPDPTGGASASASSHRHMMGRKSGERARIVRSSPEMTMSGGRSPKHGLAADPNSQCSSRPRRFGSLGLRWRRRRRRRLSLSGLKLDLSENTGSFVAEHRG
jgi:hypothetical protein